MRHDLGRVVRASTSASALVLGALVISQAGPSYAGNGVEPRIEPSFGEVPCMQVVDRSVDPIFHLEYSIPEEDTELSEDEPPDSRRHQFFAFARQAYGLPMWITDDDVAAAEAVGLHDADNVPDEEILEATDAWAAGEWARLNPDDARIPITFEAAAQGVDWDTSDVAAGTYVIAGYTWEPLLNAWTWRRGAVRVVDGDDAHNVPPSLYLAPQPGWAVVEGESVSLEGCAVVPEGTQVRLEWATWSANHNFDWQPAGDERPVASGDVALDFDVPRIGTGDIVVRATARAPDGDTYAALTPTTINVLEDLSGDDEGEGGDGTGCSVASSVGSPTPSPSALLGLLALVFLRRRGGLERD